MPSPASNEPAITRLHTELLEKIEKQDEELNALREQLNNQSAVDTENIQGRLETQERFWKSRLKKTESEHQQEVEDLKRQFEQAKEIQTSSHLADYESKFQELMVHASRQDEALKAQAEQIFHLSKLQSLSQMDDRQQEASVLRSQSEKHIKASPIVTFAELANRIESSIRANTHSPNNSASKRKGDDNVASDQSSRQTPKPFLSPNTSSSIVVMKNIESPSENSNSSQSTKQTVINITNASELKPLVTTTEVEKISCPQDDSSSDSSPRTENIESGKSMYRLVDKNVPKQKQTSSTPDKAWNDSNLRSSVTSLKGSKDSGLDSPKRFPTAISKINAFKMPSVKSGSIDSVDNANNMYGEEEMDDEVEDEEEEEEEDVSEEETVEETETESDAGAKFPVRSIHSMENALHQNPEILTELKEDLRGIIDRRLRELGIDPEWEGIPAATYKQKCTTLKHHQNITAKRHKSFFKIRQKLENELERRLSKRETENQLRSERRGKEQQKNDSQQNRMAVRKFVGKVTTKAISVLKRSTGKLTSHAVKQTQNVPSSHHPKTISEKQIQSHQRQIQKHDSKNRKSKGLSRKNVSNSRHEKKGGKMQVRSATSTSSRSTRTAEESAASNVTMVTSTPHKTVHAVSPRGSILKGSKMPITSELASKNEKSLSVSSLEEDEDSIEEEEEDYDDEEEDKELDDISDIDTGETSTVSGKNKDFKGKVQHPESVKDSQSEKKQSSLVSRQNTTPKSKDLSSDVLTDQESPKGSKSVLKTQSTSSLGSITKKRVLFVDQNSEHSSKNFQDLNGKNLHQTKSLPWNVSKVITNSRLSKSAETLAVKPTTMNASPRSPKSVTFASSHSASSSSGSDSDWGISSIPESLDKSKVEETGPSLSGSYERINLSTKQSAKIAQISKSIEKQLSLSKSKPPTGGVEAMFRASGTAAPEKTPQNPGIDSVQSYSSFPSSTSVGSLVSDGNCENDMNIGNTNSTVKSAPIPKPRSNQPTTVTQPTSSKLTLSEWDLEDFDD